jgi:probable HAF family extracellular repeat protein
MNARTVLQKSALSGFIPAGQISRSVRTLLSMLALYSAVVGWSQAVENLPGPPVPSNLSPGVAMKVPPAPALSGIFSVRQRMQQARVSTNGASAVTPAQTPAPALETAKYYFVNITISNAAYVEPTAINNAGEVAGYYADANFITHGFVWQDGTVQTIDYPGATATAFGGINNRGVLVGAYQDVSLNTFVVTYSLANSAWTVLPDIPGGWQQEFYLDVGINDDGIAVGCAGQFGLLSWVWHTDTQSYSYFTASAAAEASTCADAINNRRNVVGSMATAYSNSGFAFLRRNRDEYATISLPSSLSGTLTAPYGINNSDTIVGSFYTATSGSGFVRTRRGLFTVVNEPAYDYTYLSGINDFGVLCGFAYSSATGQSPGFVAYPQK